MSTVAEQVGYPMGPDAEPLPKPGLHLFLRFRVDGLGTSPDLTLNGGL